MIATTIINSINVKPLDLASIFPPYFARYVQLSRCFRLGCESATQCVGYASFLYGVNALREDADGMPVLIGEYRA
jgi:hypothetical protein